MKRLAVARLWYEANSFSPRPSGMRDLMAREWTAGAAALDAFRGTATELGGLAAWLGARPGWQAHVIRAASAQPAGPLEDAALAAWLEEVEQALRSGGHDALYLSLHGACQSASDPTADLTILRRLRRAAGTLPIGASFDLHGNMAPETAGLLDVMSAYRTHPHVDMAPTAQRVLDMLADAAEGGFRPVVAAAKVPRVLHSQHMRTDAGPMAELVALARVQERGAVRDVAVFGGFAWGDSPHAGASVFATADADRIAAQSAADTVAQAFAARFHRFDVTLPGPEEALHQALASPPGLVALLDPADNPLSGGLADTPALLRTLLARPAGVPVVFAFLHDPDTVAAARAAGPGATLARPLGARVTEAFGPPVPTAMRVERLTDGRFVNAGPMERGATVSLGPTAVLRDGALQVIVTSECQAAIDPAFFALHGIDLDATRLLAVKGKNHFRAAFQDRCAAIVDCECPGPAGTDLRSLPFRHVPPRWLGGPCLQTR